MCFTILSDGEYNLYFLKIWSIRAKDGYWQFIFHLSSLRTIKH